MKFLLAAVLTCLSLPAFGQMGYDLDDIAYCKDMGGLGRDVMFLRQHGTSLSEMMGALDMSRMDSVAIMQAIMIEAFQEDQYYSDELKAIAIERFGEKTETDCFLNM